MMTASNMKYILTTILVGCALFLQAADIKINQSDRQIVASSGCEYQWYFNNEKLVDQTEQTVTVKESGKYAVEITDEFGNVEKHESIFALTATGAIIKIYLIGDSTVCNYGASVYPMMGWGQMIAYFFNKANVVVDNRAIGGRSSRSFYEEGRWTTVKDLLQPGDFVFIQFGHNDRDTKPERYTSTHNYKKYLSVYVSETKSRGGFPVLVSPMVMNAWRNGVMRNVFTEVGNDYRGAMKTVADSLKVPFVDLNMKSWNLFKSLGSNYLDRFVYHTYPAGEYPNYPTGSNDGTHFKISGATENARMVVEGLKESADVNIKNLLVPNLLPLYNVSAGSNLTGADSMISRTVSYPPGIEVTVKVIPKAKSTFLNWSDASNKSVTTDRKYVFTMGNAPVKITAMFKGGVLTNVDEEGTLFSSEAVTAFCFPNPFLYKTDLKLDGLFQYTIFDVDGQIVETGNGYDKVSIGQTLPSGFYFLNVNSNDLTHHFKLIKN